MTLITYYKRDEPVRVNLFLPGLKAATVKQVYQNIALSAAQDTGLSPAYVFEHMLDQELREGSAIGAGVALPHLRLKKLSHPFLLFARIDRPVDFSALDRQDVDIVALLLSPYADVPSHLFRLSRLTRMLRDVAFCRTVRSIGTQDELEALFVEAQRDLRTA